MGRENLDLGEKDLMYYCYVYRGHGEKYCFLRAKHTVHREGKGEGAECSVTVTARGGVAEKDPTQYTR